MRFHVGRDPDQGLPPVGQTTGQPPFRLRQSLAALARSLSRYQIRQPLDLGQVQLVVDEGPPGKFPRLC